MSLLVWLPMTKDLTQQGLSDITVSNVGATLDNNGKLGKCYYFDGNAHYLEFSKTLGDIYCGDFSYAVWLKPTDDTRSIICSEYAATGGSGIAFELTASRAIRLYWGGNPDIQPSNCVLAKDTWTHVAITRSGDVAKFYINGTLTYTYSGTLSNRSSSAKIRLGDDYRGGTSVSYMGYMNDFRLYDHCLAPKEIEILSRGLVCHYPLNGNGRTNENMCTWGYSQNPKIPNNAGNTVLSITDYGEYQRYTCTTAGTTGGKYGYPRTAGDLAQGTVYTWSAEFRASKPLTFTGSSYIGMEGGGMLAGSEIKIGTGWTKLSKTWTQTTSQAFVLYPKGDVAVGDWIDMRNLKIEVGDKATPYIPNPADSAYTAMGYNSTTEYDVSGYGNNMTKTGTITYTSDSARYSVASHFINESYIMANQNCGEYLPKDSLTVNIWVKPTTWGNPISCTEGGGWNIEESGSGLQFQCYISGVGYKPAKCSVTGSSLVDSKWHMLTGVFDRAAQQTKFYIDGELKATGSTGSTNGVGYASNRLIISGEAQSTTPASSAFVGEESDVRIYATALSDTQVAELYNTAVSVADNGTLMGYELVEG